MNRRGLAAGIAVALLLAAPARAQLVARTVLRVPGAASGDLLGANVVRGGDLNGDGFVDLLIAATRADANYPDAGRVYVLLGGSRLDSIPDASAAGRTPGGLAGTSMACIGDVNADGYDDWFVGSPMYDTGVPPRFPGKGWVYFGGATLDATSDRTLDLPGTLANAGEFGISASPAGDFNGDGVADFVVSAAVLAPDSTSALVFFGDPGFDSFADLALRTGVGFTVRSCSTGDVNGDGWSDIVVGESPQVSPGHGRVQVFYGGPGADAVADVTILATASGDNFGLSVSSGGDLNGDGVDDIAVGAFNASPNGASFAGRAFVYFGGPAMDDQPDLVIPGSAILDNLGRAVAIDGDLDGDGLADLLVGVPGADGAGADAGRVLVFFGRATMRSTPDLVVDGEAAGELFGASVAYAGDPDQGGTDAFLVGAPSSDAAATNAGRVELCRVERFRVLQPAAGETWTVGDAGALRWLGADTLGVDLSADGGLTWRPLVDGLPGASGVRQVEVPVDGPVTGRARLRFTRSGRAPGSGESTLSPGEFHVTRRTPGDAVVFESGDAARGSFPGRLGAALALGVDATGDGVPDLVAGEPFADRGAIRILPEPGGPPAEPVTREGATPFERFGAAVADAGDLNGDGWDDLAVGAPACAVAGPDAGRVYVHFGGPGAGSAPDRILEGRRAREAFGTAIAAAGDVNGDGFADLAVGAPGVSGDGRVYVFHGGPGFGDVPGRALAAGVAGPFGLAVSGAGDVNHDGFADLLVSGPPMPGGTGSSSVHLFLGAATGRPLRRVVLDGLAPGDGFGETLAGLGDMNGDGYDDFAIGVPFADVAGAADAGLVQLFYGAERLAPGPAWTWSGPGAGSFFGSAIAGRADLNGDGRPDVVIGAPGSDGGAPDEGLVTVWYRGRESEPDGSFAGSAGSRMGTSLAVRGTGGDARFGVIAVGAPFADSSAVAVRGTIASRWRWTDPARETSWLVGAHRTLRWQGASPADLWFVGFEGGETPLAAGVGGANANTLDLALPGSLPDSGRLELRAGLPAVRGRVAGATIRVERGVALRSSAWFPRAAGIELHWSTEPPLGPGGVSGYRLWRESRGNSGRTAIGGVIVDTTAIDPQGVAGDTYALTAIGADGAEFDAGTFDAGSAISGVRVWPQPAGESGEVALRFAAPRVNGEVAADLEVRVYDTRGRLIRTLARGRPATRGGVVDLRWDGRTDRGDRTGPGVYFLRVRARSAAYEVTRRVVMLDVRR